LIDGWVLETNTGGHHLSSSVLVQASHSRRKEDMYIQYSICSFTHQLSSTVDICIATDYLLVGAFSSLELEMTEVYILVSL
jgi:hypothetical protein